MSPFLKSQIKWCVILFSTNTYSVEVEPFEFSFIPTLLNMLPISSFLGFVVKLHRLSLFYEQSFLFIFTCSSEGTQAATMLHFLRTIMLRVQYSFRERVVEL